MRYDLRIKVRNLSMLLNLMDPAAASPAPSSARRALFSSLAQGLRTAEDGLSSLANGRSEGIADFRSGTSLLTRRWLGVAYETRYQPGRVVQRRRNGIWHEKRPGQGEGSAMWSPIWLVELPRGATSASAVGQETVNGLLCQFIRATAVLDQAAASSRFGMNTLLLPDRREYPISLEAWIDSAGRLRRVKASLPRAEPNDVLKETTTGSFELTLSDFGQLPAQPRE